MDHPLSFHEHLGELRTRLVRSLGAVGLGVIVAWFARIELFDLLSGPVREGLANNGIYTLTAIELPETILVYLKLSVVAGIVLASPVVFYQLWAFVAPGLHKHERSFVAPITAFSVGFFLLGVAFCHQVLLPFVTDFLASMTLDHPDVNIQVTVRNAFSFSITLLLAFGIAFELPLLLFFLCAIGVSTPRSLLRFFRYFVVLSFIVGALFTPPDPISQLMMAIPLNLLYLLGIGMSAVAARRKEATGSSALDGRTWLVVGLALTLTGTGISYGIWRLGQSPSLLDHVPGDARLVAGLRWADTRSRAVFAESASLFGDLVGEEHALVSAAHEALGVLDHPREDSPSIEELLVYVTHDGASVALFALSADFDEPFPPGAPFHRIAEAVVALGDESALARGARSLERGLTMSALAHRTEHLEALRRRAPAWATLWPDPLSRGEIFQIVVGDWDRPLVAASFRATGEIEVQASLAPGSPTAAARLARTLDTWRERQSAAERQRAIDESRDEERRRHTARLASLTEAVQQVAALAVREDETGEASRAMASLAKLGAELGAELAAAPVVSPESANPGRLGVDDVSALEASAAGQEVTVTLRLSPRGAARLLSLAVVLVAGGLPTTLPEQLVPTAR